MAKTQERLSGTEAVYSLQGTLLEACSCNILCPCWVNEEPDGGACAAFNAYHFDTGTIRGVDVSGLSIAMVVNFSGRPLDGGWRVVVLVDKKATPEQKQAIIDAYTGQLGGPLADVYGLVGEVLGVIDADIRHEVADGKGTLQIEGYVYGEMEPYRGPDGTITTLRDSTFSTVPGSPAWVGKASVHRVDIPEHGYVWSFEDRNAIQATYVMEYTKSDAR